MDSKDQTYTIVHLNTQIVQICGIGVVAVQFWELHCFIRKAALNFGTYSQILKTGQTFFFYKALKRKSQLK